MSFASQRLAKAKSDPGYIEAFDNQSEREKSYIENLPKVQGRYFKDKKKVKAPAVAKKEKTQEYTKQAYQTMCKSRNFKKNANFLWLNDYDIFVKDMGTAPRKGSRIKLLNKMTTYTRVTCYWS